MNCCDELNNWVTASVLRDVELLSVHHQPLRSPSCDTLHQTGGRPDVRDHPPGHRLQDYPLHKIKPLQLVTRFRAHHTFQLLES